MTRSREIMIISGHYFWELKNSMNSISDFSPEIIGIFKKPHKQRAKMSLRCDFDKN